jgi:hypothetical protein
MTLQISAATLDAIVNAAIGEPFREPEAVSMSVGRGGARMLTLRALMVDARGWIAI